jgi:hypothetical protein
LAKQGLQIEIDWTGYLAAIRKLRPPELDRPVALALVDTAKAANTRAASAIAKHTGLKVSVVKPKLFFDRVNVGTYHTFLRSSRKPWRMSDFKATQTQPGVRVSKPWGKTQVLKGAFLANVGGRTGVFRRVGRARLPIKEQFGPSAHSTFKQPYVVAIVKEAIKARLPVLLARRVNAEIRRGKR